jgi:ADP-ribosylglycohydrolase
MIFHLYTCTKDINVFSKLTETILFNGPFQIRASEALRCALWMFTKYGISDPEQCLIKTVSLGGDTDTGFIL